MIGDAPRILSVATALPPHRIGHCRWEYRQIAHAFKTLISPHVGGNTTAFLPRAYRLVAAQLHRFVDGEPLVNEVQRPTA